MKIVIVWRKVRRPWWAMTWSSKANQSVKKIQLKIVSRVGVGVEPYCSEYPNFQISCSVQSLNDEIFEITHNYK
jgi:hypothetical protein